MNIVLTGGGTAGHAMVNQVLAGMMRKDGANQVFYIGSHHGAERELMGHMDGVTYFPISTGKLRRYCSFENAKDLFRVCQGIAQAYKILKREEANVVFSGGGFVSLPVVLAARLLNIPVLIRETDLTVGLANRICARFAQKIFTTFPDTVSHLKGISCEYGGLIVRSELLIEPVNELGIRLRPTVLVMGGSLGSALLNQTIWGNVRRLAKQFCIKHLCGKGQSQPTICAPDYVQYDYANDMAGFYAQADVVVTRCGSNAISEGLALGKRMVCIPISTRFSRGEQLSNARYAAEHGCAVILEEKTLSGEVLEKAIQEVLQKSIKQDCVLSKNALNENCRHLLREIQTAAAVHYEQQMIEKVKDNRIDWSGLSTWEFQLCDEVGEEYYC